MQGISQGLEYGTSALATARLGGFKAEGKVLDTGRPNQAIALLFFSAFNLYGKETDYIVKISVYAHLNQSVAHGNAVKNDLAVT